MNQNEKVTQLANEIPTEIKDAVKGLDDDTRLAILVLLLKDGKMTFSQLKDTLHLNSSSLSSNLSVLQNGGLVTNMLEWKNKSYSYYMATNLTKSIIRSLFDLIIDYAKTPVAAGGKESSLKPAMTNLNKLPNDENAQVLKEFTKAVKSTLNQTLYLYRQNEVSTYDDKQLVTVQTTT